MHSIQSEDGTPIRYFRRGHGPAILLIHGTAADHSRWAPVLPALQRHFTLYAMDRRGRGGSGDAAAYRMDHERGRRRLGQFGTLLALQYCLCRSSDGDVRTQR